MKPDMIKQLVALHAQCSAMVQQLEAIIDVEVECPHEDIEDLSTMGQQPRTHYVCRDCGQEFGA